MPDLIYAGIDEAGYGPMLGPLCVGLTIFRVRDWNPGETPDLWERLSPAVCRKPRDPKRRIAVADSKKLKGSNALKRAHPLQHLERGALAFLATNTQLPTSDASLFRAVGADLRGAQWYTADRTDLPQSGSAQDLQLDAALLTKAMSAAGIELLDARCRVIDAPRFNDQIRRSGSKGAITLAAARDAIRRVMLFADSDDKPNVRIAADRLGARMDYAPMLASALGEEPTLTHRAEHAVRYETNGGDAAVVFQSEAEEAHFPVALASMFAKLVRELAMARFNRYWSMRAPDLKPTAGYTADARRWLKDAAGILSREERDALVRIA